MKSKNYNLYRRKTLFIFISAFFLFINFAGCKKEPKTSKKYTIVSTIFPEYDWIKELLGEASNFDNQLLVKNGVDLHSFQPSTADIIKLSTADIVVYVGGESDFWIQNALKNAANKNIKAISLMETLGSIVQEEELIEGMQSEEKTEAEPEYDEHVWLSLKNAQLICQKIAQELGNIDKENQSYYMENYNNYSQKLMSLNQEFFETINTSKTDTLVFCDRFPFRYLTDSYNIKYFAAFAGCSAETEASFETVAFLTNKLNELQLPVVLVIETSDKKLAQTVISNSKNKNTKIEVLDSMQNTTLNQANNGKTYLSTMKMNLETLTKALN